MLAGENNAQLQCTIAEAIQHLAQAAR
jgi:hypothetical protein